MGDKGGVFVNFTNSRNDREPIITIRELNELYSKLEGW